MTKHPIDKLKALLKERTPLSDIKIRDGHKQYKFLDVLVDNRHITSKSVRERMLTATNGGQKPSKTSTLFCAVSEGNTTSISSTIPHVIIFMKDRNDHGSFSNDGKKAFLKGATGTDYLSIPIDPIDPQFGSNKGVPLKTLPDSQPFVVIATPSFKVSPDGKISPLTWTVSNKNHCDYYPGEAAKLAYDLGTASLSTPRPKQLQRLA